MDWGCCIDSTLCSESVKMGLRRGISRPAALKKSRAKSHNKPLDVLPVGCHHRFLLNHSHCYCTSIHQYTPSSFADSLPSLGRGISEYQTLHSIFCSIVHRAIVLQPPSSYYAISQSLASTSRFNYVSFAQNTSDKWRYVVSLKCNWM